MDGRHGQSLGDLHYVLFDAGVQSRKQDISREFVEKANKAQNQECFIGHAEKTQSLCYRQQGGAFNA